MSCPQVCLLWPTSAYSVYFYISVYLSFFCVCAFTVKWLIHFLGKPQITGLIPAESVPASTLAWSLFEFSFLPFDLKNVSFFYFDNLESCFWLLTLYTSWHCTILSFLDRVSYLSYLSFHNYLNTVFSKKPSAWKQKLNMIKAWNSPCETTHTWELYPPRLYAALGLRLLFLWLLNQEGAFIWSTETSWQAHLGRATPHLKSLHQGKLS